MKEFSRESYEEINKFKYTNVSNMTNYKITNYKAITTRTV